MDDLAIGSPVNIDFADTLPAQFKFKSPGGKFVFTVTGTAQAVTGIYMGPKAVGTAGKLRINPGDKPCVCELHSVGHTIVVTPSTPGSYQLDVRRWEFADYFRALRGDFRGKV